MRDDSAADIAVDQPNSGRPAHPDATAQEPASGVRRRDLEGYSLETLSAILDP
jgi:hypothetical protein